MPYRARIWGDIRTVRVIPVGIRIWAVTPADIPTRIWAVIPVGIRIWAVTPADIPMVPGILRACRRGIRRALRVAG